MKLVNQNHNQYHAVINAINAVNVDLSFDENLQIVKKLFDGDTDLHESELIEITEMALSERVIIDLLNGHIPYNYKSVIAIDRETGDLIRNVEHISHYNNVLILSGSVKKYVIDDAITNAGGPAPDNADWHDAYSNYIEFYASDDKSALTIAETMQSLHDDNMIDLYPGINQHDSWYNAPCYISNLFKIVDDNKIKID